MTESETTKNTLYQLEEKMNREHWGDIQFFEEKENRYSIAVGKAILLIKELEQYRAVGTVEEFKKSVKEEDVLKFYYIESEDKYVVGQRIDTHYYAEVGKTGLCFYMSRYLPWGKDGFPSEPKEIPFFDWLQGFVKKEYGGTVEEFKALKEKNDKDFELLLKAVKESYPMFKGAYVEFDVFMGDVMRRFTRERK